MDDYVLAEHELTLLRQACRVADTCEELQEHVDRDGALLEGKVHPALVELRQQRIILARLVVALRVPIDDEPSGQSRAQRRVRALRCALRGHHWASQPTAAGTVLILCDRCRELLMAPFVDEPAVLRLEALSGLSTWMGDAISARQALDLLAAMLTRDLPAEERLRAQVAARSTAAVESLSLLALAFAHESADPLRYVRDVAARIELAMVGAELKRGNRTDA